MTELQSVALNLLSAAIFAILGYLAARLQAYWKNRHSRWSWNLLEAKSSSVSCVVPVLDQATGRVGWYEMEAYALLATSAELSQVKIQLRKESGSDQLGLASEVILGGLPSSGSNRLIWTRMIEPYVKSFNVQQRGITLDPFSPEKRKVCPVERGDDGHVIDYGYLYVIPNRRLRVGSSGGYTVGLMGVWGYGLLGAATVFTRGRLNSALKNSRASPRDGFVALVRVHKLGPVISSVSLMRLEVLAQVPHGLRDINGQPSPAVYMGSEEAEND